MNRKFGNCGLVLCNSISKSVISVVTAGSLSKETSLKSMSSDQQLASKFVSGIFLAGSVSNVLLSDLIL